jgi:hypothetical protein
VTEHADFKTEFLDEYRARCGDYVRQWGKTPSVFEKLKILKDSAHRTTKFIRRICGEQVAETTEHKLATAMSFLRAVHVRDLRRAKGLQRKCVEL